MSNRNAVLADGGRVVLCRFHGVRAKSEHLDKTPGQKLAKAPIIAAWMAVLQAPALAIAKKRIYMYNIFMHMISMLIPEISNRDMVKAIEYDAKHWFSSKWLEPAMKRAEILLLFLEKTTKNSLSAVNNGTEWIYKAIQVFLLKHHVCHDPLNIVDPFLREFLPAMVSAKQRVEEGLAAPKPDLISSELLDRVLRGLKMKRCGFVHFSGNATYTQEAGFVAVEYERKLWLPSSGTVC